MTAPPFYADEAVTLHLGDCLDVLPTLADASVDAVVCDPPYGLGFMGKEWDTPGTFFERKAAKTNTFDHVGGNHNPSNSADAARTRHVEGVKFGQWCELWARECLRVLKPGGHMVAFGGTRTYHRLACAIEDAGFEIRDSMHWIYGSGMPKGIDVSKAIDAAGGASPVEQAAVLRIARERAGLTRDQVATAVGCTAGSIRDWEDGRARAKGRAIEHIVPSPQYRDALADLLGYTQDERVVVGAGGGSRGLYETGHRGVQYGESVTALAARWSGWNSQLKPAHEPIVLARRPLDGTVAANVLRHGTGAINVDGCRTGQTVETWPSSRGPNTGNSMAGGVMEQRDTGAVPPGRWPTNVLLAHPPLLDATGQPIGDACADGCVPGCPVAEMDRQSGVTRSSGGSGAASGRPGQNVYGTYGQDAGANAGGLGDSGGASRFFPVFRYEAKAPASERPRLADGTAWPTVKPLELMRWLVRLVTPPGGTVLDWCAGTGTTLEAAAVEGFPAIGIERERQGAELCRVRLSKPLEAVLFGDIA